MISPPIAPVSTLAELFLVQRLSVEVLCAFVRDLTAFEHTVVGLKGKRFATATVTEPDQNVLQPILDMTGQAAAFLYLPATNARAKRLADALQSGCVYPELATQLRILRETLEDELQTRIILYMPAGQAINFHAGAELLGPNVLDRFPGQSADIDEAGKCLGTGRWTATVFHLMRVMEAGVQEFGIALGVTLTSTKNWHNIVEEAEKAIRALLSSDPDRAELAELASLLHAVKLAWRNEVMHPKATYVEEEANNVLDATKAFMNKLALLLEKRAGTP